MDLFNTYMSPVSLHKLGRVDILLDLWIDSSLIEAYSGSGKTFLETDEAFSEEVANSTNFCKIMNN